MLATTSHPFKEITNAPAHEGIIGIHYILASGNTFHQKWRKLNGAASNSDSQIKSSYIQPCHFNGVTLLELCLYDQMCIEQMKKVGGEGGWERLVPPPIALISFRVYPGSYSKVNKSE